jgi:hypothetical protein
MSSSFSLAHARRVFGFAAGYWAAGFVWQPSWADFAALYPDPALQRALQDQYRTSPDQPPRLIVVDGLAIPARSATGALWAQARRAPVARDDLLAAVAADGPDAWAHLLASVPVPGSALAPPVTPAPRVSEDPSAVAQALITLGLFVAWPTVLDPVWSWDELYVVPSSRAAAPPWYLVQPDLPALALSVHRNLLARRLILTPSAWRPLRDSVRAGYRAYRPWAHATFTAPSDRVPGEPPWPPLLPLWGLRTQAVAVGLLSSADASGADGPADRAAAALVERHLPRLLRQGATLVAWRAPLAS